MKKNVPRMGFEIHRERWVKREVLEDSKCKKAKNYQQKIKEEDGIEVHGFTPSKTCETGYFF